MHESVYGVLAPVSRRQQVGFALRLMAYGLLAGSLLGLVFGVISWIHGGPLSLVRTVSIVVAAGPAIALVTGAIGFLWRRSLHDAAVAVDRHYRLKDRSATALDFAARPTPSPLQTLQIADALHHLQLVDPRQVAPLKQPRSLPYALGLWVCAASLAVALIFSPFGRPNVEAGPVPPPPQVVAEAERLGQSLQDLEEIARQEEIQELATLIEQQRKKVEEMKQSGIDKREALAKLSEMEAAIQAQQAQYNTALVDGQLQSLGSAMCAAAALEGAGKALEENKLDKAAQEMEKLDEPELERKEVKVVEQKLKQVAKEMGEAGLGQLSGAVADFAESLKGGKGKGKKATRTLAREIKNQARRKRVAELLNGVLDNLKEAKSNVQNNSLVKGKMPYKSTTPTSTFGAETSGNVQGEKTNLLGQNKQVDVTGTPGEGPSDVESTTSPEARQQARRGYKDVYKKYRKMSDAVLDSEPIPLGHRQTIRRYFELIRPQNADMTDKKGN